MDFKTKNVIYFFLFFLTFAITAQNTPGNLQFNSIKTLTFEDVVSGEAFSNTRRYIMGEIIVPSGKVWKVTNSSLHMKNSDGTIFPFSGSSANANGSVFGMLRIGGQVIKQVGYYKELADHNTPIWISEGTYEIKIDASYYLNMQLFYISINAIEFNIVN